jgi:low temperature requirement protein LtrA
MSTDAMVRPRSLRLTAGSSLHPRPLLVLQITLGHSGNFVYLRVLGAFVMPHRLVRPIRLWPATAADRRVTWLELFFDLIFVAAVAQVGLPLASDYSLAGLARYAVMFLLIWWAWLGHTLYCTRFDTDDLVQRLLTLVQIFAAAVMAANARDVFGSRDSAGFGAAYAVLRAVLVIQYLRARRVPETRSLTSLYSFGFGIAAVLWGAAAFAPVPARFWIWGLALAADLGTPWLAVRASHEFPPNAAHLPERFGLFTIILLGESVAAVMLGMQSQETWNPPAATSALFGLGLIFGYWWWYFDGARGAAERHITSRRDNFLFHIWSYAHLPLYLSLAVAGVGLRHSIALAPGARLQSQNVWILAGAAAVAMSAITAIGQTTPQLRRTPALLRYGLAFCALAIAPPATHFAPFALVIGLAVLCTLQVMLTIRENMSSAANAAALPASFGKPGEDFPGQ